MLRSIPTFKSAAGHPFQHHKTQRSWSSGTNVDTLGWGPDGKVRGRYKVESTSTTDFLVTGECDVDNDDDNASFTATKSLNTKMNTGATAY